MLQITCEGCGTTQPVSCPGFGRHALLPIVQEDGTCALCGASFDYVTCGCGTVKWLKSQEPSIQQMFGALRNELDEQKSLGNMTDTRHNGLSDFMARLGTLVKNESSDEKSLEDLLGEREQMDMLVKDMMARIKKPSFGGDALPADTRAARVLELMQELKSFVFSEGMKQYKSDAETQKTQELFARIARVTKSINDTRGDDGELIALETDQLRGLANEVRLFARRNYVTLAQPVWSHANVVADPNRLFFAGPEQTRKVLAPAAERIGLELNPPVRVGADAAEARWQDLRAANLAVFDISTPSAQTYYELGIALALGTELLLVAKEDSDPPFDIAQNVHHYAAGDGLEAFFSEQLDCALYGLQCNGADGSSLTASVEYASRLAEPVRAGNGQLRVALDSLRKSANDPLTIPACFKLVNRYLGGGAQMLLYPRKPAAYSDGRSRRCFIVMPFREELDDVHDTIARTCREAHVEPVRGDVARGQEIIDSIWEEIGRATHVTVDLTNLNPNVCLELGIADTLGRRTLLIGKKGTAERLKRDFPSIAKRRCHAYPGAEFQRTLLAFMREG